MTKPKKPVDKVLAVHRASGIRFVAKPEYAAGYRYIWIQTAELLLGVCDYKDRAVLARWLRQAADRIERG